MCGIFGYIGSKDVVGVTLKGLKKMEYRGYDSAGIAGVIGSRAICYKDVGKIAGLKQLIKDKTFTPKATIAHTRWATHGKPSPVNAHPHFDQGHSLAVVHNGIIENHDILRKKLEKKGVIFDSETDSEVIAQLIADCYTGDILKAMQQTIALLEGAFAIAIIHKDFPNQIFIAAHESPLVIGLGKKEIFVASDVNAFIQHTRDVVYLSHSEMGVIKKNSLEVYDMQLNKVIKEQHRIKRALEEVSKGSFEHFTLKEIFEQPKSLERTLFSRFLEEYGTAKFENFSFDVNYLHSVSRILILACGTSWHAGYVSAYLLEDIAGIPVQVEISSEFRYKNSIVQENTLVIAISQSGETADTIAAMRELKAKGAKILGVCNVEESTIAREADNVLFLCAGPEIGVCSTKAFTSQVAILALFTLFMARMRHMSKHDGQILIQKMKELPDQVQDVLDRADQIKKMAKKYAHFNNIFFLGRRYMFPASLEAALKLKEISYINAQGYPAGEMKHGPIALIDENCPTVALCADKMTYSKILNNLMEVKARKGPVIVFAEQGSQGLEKIADDIFYLPLVIDELASIPTSVAMQLFAYYVAKERGTEIDQPRNLAKSVTVE